MTDEERRDEGSVLPLVLVMMVIGALIVVPLLDYTIAVFRSNNVVSDRTAQSEAAKGGLRVALADPKNVFLTCDGGGNLTPSPNPPINGISVQTTCTELDEIGPIEATGFEVPIGAAAMQLGADVPVAFSGTTASSGPALPYPASPDWWATPDYGVDPINAQYAPDAIENKIWMPDLPRIPSTNRTATPFDMPAAYDCKVFFPGRYADPVNVSGRTYFTSGVYYFEDAVTIDADADVVVGYGLEDFSPASDCADDLQVASNVLSPPSTFGISGGGATWVFGVDGRFVVDNAAMASGARVRFNQRYDTADRGGRVSIMSVNGDDVTAAADHVVTNVNRIPRSSMLNDTTPLPIDGTGYVPSSSTYSDKARLPLEVVDLAGLPFQQAGADPNRGVVLLSWDESVGQLAGGALLGEQDMSGTWTTLPYEVQFRRESGGSWTDVCFPDELVLGPQAVPTDGDQLSCSISGLEIGTDYRFQVRAVNDIGTGPWEQVNVTAEASSPIVAVPDAPPVVDVLPGVADDVAQIVWTEPADNGGAPITGYQVDSYRIEHVVHPNLPPVAGSADEHIDIESPLLTPTTQTLPVRAYDPNGDDLTLAIDVSLLPPGITATSNDADDTITVDAAPLSPVGVFSIPYTVTDPSGEIAAGQMDVHVVPLGGIIPHDPIADRLNLSANLDEAISERLPVSDSDGTPLSNFTLDTSTLDVTTWTVNITGDVVTITTTAPDGLYSIPYTVTDPSGRTANNTIEVTVDARRETAMNSCSTTADPINGIPTACEMSLPDLTPGTMTVGDQGYRFDVMALNEVGPSVPASNPAPYPFRFDGGGVGLLPDPPRVVEPWIPEPIIDIEAGGGASVEIAIAGYVATPMGRIEIANPNGFDIKINGGVMSGTFAVADSRDTGVADSLPMGFKNDIVLQRKVRIVSQAGNVTSIAIVEVNEDGAGYGVNTWVVG